MANIPRLKDLINDSDLQANEINSIDTETNKLKWFNFNPIKLEFKSIIKFERITDLLLKYAIVFFIGFILYKQIIFVNNLILGVAIGKLKLDSSIINIFIAATVVEFILGIKMVIKSLFPEGDRKDSLTYMQDKTLDNSTLEENEQAS